MKRLPWARRAAKVALPPIQRPPRVTPPGPGAVALFGWTLGNSWQHGLVHIWCADLSCRRDLDWVTEQFHTLHPAAMCGPCAARRDAREDERQWAEAHIIRSEVPGVVHADAEVIRVAPLRLVPPPPDAIEDRS